MSRSAHVVRRVRLILALVGIGILLGAGLVEVQAQTLAETDVTITVIDDGVLDVRWATSDGTFLANGESPALTAANPSITAGATFTLSIDDTRTDTSRAGYAISLRASALTAESSSVSLEPDRLAIADIDGLPGGAASSDAIGQSLGAPVTVLTVEAGAEAVSTTVTVTIELTLTPGDLPGVYQGGITFDVTPLSGP